MHGYRGNPIKYDLSGCVNAHILIVAVFYNNNLLRT